MIEKKDINGLNELIEKIKKEKNIWAIGERKWSFENYNNFKNNNDEKTGIFFFKEIKNEDFSDCYKVYFFNKDIQYCILNRNKDYFFSEKKFSYSEGEIEDYYIISEGKYKFAFSNASAKKLKSEEIKVLRNKKNGEWRFYHE